MAEKIEDLFCHFTDEGIIAAEYSGMKMCVKDTRMND